MTTMSVTDPDCGVCQTLTWPSGKTLVIEHSFPKALRHYYPLPALEAASIPIYRGDFDLEGGTRYRGVINIDLEPSPRLVAHGVRETTLSAGMVKFLGKREPPKWVNFDQISIPARKMPAPARTARPPRRPPTVGAVSASYPHLSGIDVGDPTDLDEVTFYLLNGWYGLDGSTLATTRSSAAGASTPRWVTGSCVSSPAGMSRLRAYGSTSARPASRRSLMLAALGATMAAGLARPMLWRYSRSWSPWQVSLSGE